MKNKFQTVGIHCPLCDWHQTVPVDMWVFQSTEGHGYTCGSGKCPSHTYLVLDGMAQNMTELDEIEAHCREKEAAYKEMHIKYHVSDYFTREIVYGNVLEKIAEIKARRGEADGNVKKTVA